MKICGYIIVEKYIMFMLKDDISFIKKYFVFDIIIIILFIFYFYDGNCIQNFLKLKFLFLEFFMNVFIVKLQIIFELKVDN